MTTRLRTFAVLPAALVLTVSLLTACNNTAEPKAPSETMTEDKTMMETPMADDTMMDGSMEGDG